MKKLTIIVSILCVILVNKSSARESAPDFELKDLKNQRFILKDNFKNGPILLDFWAFYCKPCLEALPEIEDLHKKYADQGLQVITISNDTPRSSKKIKPYVNSHKYSFKVLLDQDKRARKLFGGVNIPYTVLIDHNGKIAFSRLGYKAGDEHTLEEKVKELLEEFNSEKENLKETIKESEGTTDE